MFDGSFFVWTLDSVLTVVALAFLAVVFGISWIRTTWKQMRCKHESVRETGTCDAICNNCNQNLGFIGNWPDRAESREG